jgi:hypothetical protein
VSGSRPSLLRVALATLLLLSAALFAVGVSIEKHDHHDVHVAKAHAGGTTAREGEAGHTEGGGEHAEHGGAGRETAGERANETKSEEVFGINLESTPLVVAVVAASLLLAGAVLPSSGSALVLVAILALAVVSAVFDVREAIHQVDESRTNLVVIASVVAALHAAAALVALALIRQTPERGAPG